MERDSDFGGIRRTYDWTTDSPSVAVVETLTDAGVDVTAIGPLYDYFDADALDTLLQTSADAGTGARLTLTFAGYAVTVRADGTVAVRSEGSPPPDP